MQWDLFGKVESISWLDTDELLLPTEGARTLDDLLAHDDFDAMSIPWRMMGDSGNTTFPCRHISADFNRGVTF